jgi:hypothetical protein
MDREVVLTSVYFFNTFLSSQATGCNSNFIQLMSAMASLFLASKLYGRKPSAISMEYLASLCHLEFTTGHLMTATRQRRNLTSHNKDLEPE